MPTVAAATYNLVMLGGQNKNLVILTIDTTGKFDATAAHDIELNVYNLNNKLQTISLTPDQYVTSTNSITITLQVGKEIPPQVSASNAVGDVGTDETFYADGPSWGWANIHK